jgi:hypothetical protein
MSDSAIQFPSQPLLLPFNFHHSINGPSTLRKSNGLNVHFPLLLPLPLNNTDSPSNIKIKVDLSCCSVSASIAGSQAAESSGSKSKDSCCAHIPAATRDLDFIISLHHSRSVSSSYEERLFLCCAPLPSHIRVTPVHHQREPVWEQLSAFVHDDIWFRQGHVLRWPHLQLLAELHHKNTSCVCIIICWITNFDFIVMQVHLL